MKIYGSLSKLFGLKINPWRRIECEWNAAITISFVCRPVLQTEIKILFQCYLKCSGMQDFVMYVGNQHSKCNKLCIS